MDFGLLRCVLDQISREGLTDQILFHVMGEPFLYPDLEKAVGYAKDKGLKVHITTNGSLVTPHILRQLLNARIDHILFSAQTPDERSFKLRKSSESFQEYKKHICGLLSEIASRKCATKVSLSFLTTPFKKLLLPSRPFSIVDTRRDLVRHVNSWLGAIADGMPDGERKAQFREAVAGIQGRLTRSNMLAWNRFTITDDFMIETRVLGDWIHEGLFARIFYPARIGSCEGLSKHLAILWNGDIVFCCVDFDGKTKFGNIKDISIADALRQKRAQEAIGGFKKLIVKEPYCQRCLGDVSFERSLMRQIGSILYFRLYRPWWDKTRRPKEALA